MPPSGDARPRSVAPSARPPQSYHLPAGSTAHGDYALSITPERAGWQQSGLHVLHVDPGAQQTISTGDAEFLALPLQGGFEIAAEGEHHVLRGRRDVFAGPTDVLYLPPGTEFVVTSHDGGRIAFGTARAERRHPVQFLAAEDAPVARRGAGNMSRKAHEYINTRGLEADKMMVLEVYTPAGNWSSYPPHKHDVDSDSETQLEEIYYYEIAPGPQGPGIAYQRVSASDDRPIDVLAEVHAGDVVLVPYGWHGPSIAPPGHDLYYLNVMSGSGEANVWRFSNDPRYEWIRDTWLELERDPRVM